MPQMFTVVTPFAMGHDRKTRIDAMRFKNTLTTH